MLPHKRRILCVDDDDDTCYMLVNLLERENYAVAAVKSVSEALQLAQVESFNLYILDAWFPREAGIGLCRKIREFDPNTPIIFYSGAAFESEKQEAIYAGADEYVAKPSIDELVDTIHRLLTDKPDSPPPLPRKSSRRKK